MVSLPVVLLIFISSNSPQENVNKGILPIPPTAEPQKGFVENGKSPKSYVAPLNDPTKTEFGFPDDNAREGLIVTNKKILREKLVPEEKNENKAPIPLYSLVKNDCGEGYALDENGVCQKSIVARSGKKLDTERRRKRNTLNYDWLIQRNQRRMKRVAESGSKMALMPCSNFYPGLVADEYGGCRKVVRTSEQPFDKALPP